MSYYVRRVLGDLTPTDPNRRQGLLAVFHIDLPLLVGGLGLGAHAKTELEGRDG